MSDTTSRRKFLKRSCFVIGGLAAALVDVDFNAQEGIRVGESNVKIGVAEASATCGSSFNCSGGGGDCGSAYDCSGGGGKCGAAYDCSGR